MPTVGPHMTVFFRATRLAIVLFVFPASGFAQDLPPNLKDIASKLGKKRATTVTFASAGPATAPACGLAPFRITLSRGPSYTFTHSVLSEPGDKARRKTIFVVTGGLASDADGSPRAYHPEDPTGTGTCTLSPGHDGSLVPSGSACALDSFSDGGIAVFKGTTQLRDSGLKEDWLQFWSLIRDRKLQSFDIEKVLGASFGYHYYGFYWKQKDMTAIFKDENVQRTADGYPCTRGASSRYPGYFVSATTLRHAADHAGADVDRPSVFALASADAGAADTAPATAGVAPAECESFRNIDSETVAYFVIPGGTLGDATIGDIVVARIKTSNGERYAYGVAADEGPIRKFGEGSLLFNQQLLGKSGPVINNRGVNALDIGHTPVAVAILGGTRDLLKGDYSQANVERVAKAEFARWGGDADPAKRMDACAAAATVIPRH
jgi:hypothetical protein